MIEAVPVRSVVTMIVVAVMLCLATGLSLDLLLSWLAQRPTPSRHVVLAIGLVALLTWRISARLVDGTL